MKRFFVSILFSFLFFSALPQSKGSKIKQIEDAEEHFRYGNYIMAIPIYKSELNFEPKNTKIKYKLGICYLNTRINREEALKYLLECSADPKCDDEVYKHLGKASLLNNKPEEAIGYLEKFKQLQPKQEEEANLYIQQCKNALAFMTQPNAVTFQNLGNEINTAEPDYYPFVNKDETFLVFTSRRKENVGGSKVEIDGYRSSDIYFSQLKNGKWTPAKNAGRALNSPLDEQAVGLSADGKELYVYIDHIDKFGDLYVSKLKESTGEFTKAKIYDPLINKKIETSGCMNEDGSLLFFARRDKLNENSDLYICRKLPTGKWAIPQKLPDNVNSKYNEDFPFLSYDEQTLYFASDGPNSMGGYDIFKTSWNKIDNTFSTPENLGYPINSCDDDRNISVTQDNSLAYLSSFRPKGFGDLDVYRVKFNSGEEVSRVFTGHVFFGDSISAHQPKEANASIIVTNVFTGVEYTFNPHSRTGKYVISLPEGVYKLNIFADNYQDYEEELAISDIGRMNIEYNKNFLLLKKK